MCSFLLRVWIKEKQSICWNIAQPKQKMSHEERSDCKIVIWISILGSSFEGGGVLGFFWAGAGLKFLGTWDGNIFHWVVAVVQTHIVLHAFDHLFLLGFFLHSSLSCGHHLLRKFTEVSSHYFVACTLTEMYTYWTVSKSPGNVKQGEEIKKCCFFCSIFCLFNLFICHHLLCSAVNLG